MNIRNHPMRFTLLSACLALGGISAALAAPKVYVANETDGTVSVIATDTRQTVRTVTVGAGAHNVQATADGQRVWVTNNGTPPADAGHAAHQGMSGAAHAAMATSGEVHPRRPGHGPGRTFVGHVAGRRRHHLGRAPSHEHE